MARTTATDFDEISLANKQHGEKLTDLDARIADLKKFQNDPMCFAELLEPAHNLIHVIKREDE